MEKTSGFTLVELMIAILILSILTAMAAPNFRNLIVSNRLSTEVNDLQTTFAFARSEAIKRNTAISICPSIDGNLCSNSWNHGWIVYVTADNSVLRKFPAINSQDNLTSSSNVMSIQFDVAGRPTVATTFNLCSTYAQAASTKQIQLTLSGKATVSSPAVCA